MGQFQLAMLRFLISHFHQLYADFSSSLPPPSSSSSLSQHQPPPPCTDPRWCFLNVDERYMEDRHKNVMIEAGDFKGMEPDKAPEGKKPRKERRAKASGGTEEAMDEEIWKGFPEDLSEAVLVRLPISSFFRFRSVCRRWNSLLESHSFSQLCAEVPQTQPWFYTITHESANAGALYDPLMKKWRHPADPSLPSKVILLPVAFAGGLVCFLDIGYRHLYVSNPITQTWKELLARSVKVWSRIAVAMTLNREGGYKVMWVARDGEYEVYDSLEKAWTGPGYLPLNIKVPLMLNFRSHAVSIETRVYFLCLEPEGIVEYDMESGNWKQWEIPMPPNTTDQSLAESGGRIMMVGMLTKNAATCVCVWELQRMTLLWKEVDRMPNVWCLEFYGKQVRMNCLGNRGLLMLSLRSRQMNQIVTYDVGRREWFKVPGCILPRGGSKRQWIACGTAFYPCLTASP